MKHSGQNFIYPATWFCMFTMTDYGWRNLYALATAYIGTHSLKECFGLFGLFA